MLLKVSAIVFWIATAVLIIELVYIRMHGSTPDRVTLAGDFGSIWGASGAIWLSLKVQAWWKKRKVT